WWSAASCAAAGPAMLAATQSERASLPQAAYKDDTDFMMCPFTAVALCGSAPGWHSLRCGSERKRRSAGLDLGVHGAGADDNDAVDEVGLLVAARLHARWAGPDRAAALLEVLDHRRKRLERRNLRETLTAFAHEVDRGAGEEKRYL